MCLFLGQVWRPDCLGGQRSENKGQRVTMPPVFGRIDEKAGDYVCYV